MLEKRLEMKQMNYEYCNGFTHTIKKGDTLYEISRKHNVPLALLLRANPYVDVFNLQVGDTICIPSENNEAVPYPVNIMPRGEVWGERRSEQREITSDGEENGMRLDNRDLQAAPDNQADQNDRNILDFPNNQNDQNASIGQGLLNNRDASGFREAQGSQNAQINRELQNERDAQINRSLRNDRNIESENNAEKFVWVKYVVQPGDTMADIVEEMDGAIEDFIERNGLSSIYMLPGVAYYIQKEGD